MGIMAVEFFLPVVGVRLALAACGHGDGVLCDDSCGRGEEKGD